MGLKYSNKTADFLQWEEATNLIRKLFKDENYSMSLLVALGCFFGLRISDILALHWNQILNVNELSIIERKTGKERKELSALIHSYNGTFQTVTRLSIQ